MHVSTVDTVERVDSRDMAGKAAGGASVVTDNSNGLKKVHIKIPDVSGTKF